jgi:ParB family chromosome partitioning protein
MKQGHLSEGHGKLLAGLPREKQYEIAYEAVKKEWTVNVLDDAIKALDEKKLEAKKIRKSSALTSPLEKKLTKQFGFSMQVKINKNETGYFRIPFHDNDHMQTILGKMGVEHSGMDVEE